MRSESNCDVRVRGWWIGTIYYLTADLQLFQRQGRSLQRVLHVIPRHPRLARTYPKQRLGQTELSVLQCFAENDGLARRDVLLQGRSKNHLRQILWKLRLALGRDDNYDPIIETSRGGSLYFKLTEIVRAVQADGDPNDIEDFVGACLEHTSYYRLPEALDILEEKRAISVFLRNVKGEMRFGAPAETRATQIIDGIMSSEEKIARSNRDYHQVRSSYLEALQKGYHPGLDEPELVPFAKKDIKPELKGQRTAVIRSFLQDGKYLAKQKNNRLRAYFLSNSKKDNIKRKGNAFRFNGRQFVLCDLRFEPDAEKSPKVHVELRYTDYYSYSLLAHSATKIYRKYGLRKLLKPGNEGLFKYTQSGFQELIHSGFGIAVMVHTLEDNKLILTERSGEFSASFKDADKLAMSAGESLNYFDLRHPDLRKEGIAPFEDIVHRAVGEELLSSKEFSVITGKTGPFGKPTTLWDLKERCLLLGALVYIPNLSCNLVFLLTLNCSAASVRRAWRESREGRFSAKRVLEELPECTPDSIYQFVAKRLKDPKTGKKSTVQWDEGSLVSLLMCAHAPAIEPIPRTAGDHRAA
jgi:hypothetical protein